MKKRILILALCVLVLVALIPNDAHSADNRLSFLAVNDYLPPELINAAVNYGGLTYIPAWILNSYSLGISYSYFASNSTAYVYNSSDQIFFELPTGRTYDARDNEYSAPAILWGGAVYLPMSFLSSYFATFTYRVIGSNAYGSILRLSNGTEMLTDEAFFRAAEASMRRYYNSLVTGATPTPRPTVPPTTEPTEKPTRKDDTIRLGLDGLPAPETLELLRRQGVRASFFLNASEIRSEPDLVRRLACEGYRLGVSGADAAACAEAAALLWETARVRAVLAALPADAGAPEGMAVFPGARIEDETPQAQQDAAYSVTNKLEHSKGSQTLIFPTGGGDTDALSIVLFYIADQDFAMTDIRETDGGAAPITP